MTATDSDYYGALVGWTSQDLGKRAVLQVQSVTKQAPHTAEDVHSFNFLIDKNQAVQLGHYLFELAGQRAQPRKKSWLDRLLGS